MHAWMGRGSRDRASLLSCLAVVLLFLGACGSDFEVSGINPANIPRGTIQGFVRDLDQPNTPVLAGIKVSLFPAHQTAITDASGFYQFPDLVPGQYEVTAQRPGNIFGQQTSADVVLLQDMVFTANLDFGLGAGVANAQQVLFLSTNGTNMAFFTTTTGTDISSTTLSSVPAPLIEARYNRANPSEFVVEAQTLGNSGIYITSPTAGTSNTVIDLATPETHPDFSPDGARVVYAGDKDSDGNFELYLINRDGTGETLLVDDFDPGTGGTFDSRDPAWSPDGVTIAFVSRRTDLLATADLRDYELQTVPARGGPILSLTEDLLDDRDPAWHPNSTSLIYAKQASGFFQLFITTSQITTPSLPLTNNFVEDRNPSISVDGRFVAWITRNNIDGSNPDASAELGIAELQGASLINPRLRTISGGGIVISSPDFRPIVP